MKNFTKIIFVALLGVAFLSQSCEKEDVSPELAVSEEAQAYHLILSEAEAKADIYLGLTAADLQAAMDAATGGLLKVEVCCYTGADVVAFLGCFGSSSASCLSEWDFDDSGVITSTDLTVLLANFGCPTVEAQLITPGYLLVSNAITGIIRNETLIDGAPWYQNNGTDVFDGVKWYFDGVYAGNNPQALQLEYPLAPDFDAAIDCNGGAHLIELNVRVDCEIYTTTACLDIDIAALRPLCTSDYCTP